MLARAARFAAATALVTTVLLGTAATATAADEVTTVEVSGSVVDTEGQPAEVESARVEETEAPGSDPVKTPIDVAEDGTFTVALREWGTAEVPAVAKFFVFGLQTDTVDDDGCTKSLQPFGVIEVAVPGQVPTEPIVVVLDQTAESGLCPPATATPEPGAQAPGRQAPDPTLPPTDMAQTSPGLGGSWAAVVLLSGVGFLAAAFVLVGRPTLHPRARRVSSTRRRGSRYR